MRTVYATLDAPIVERFARCADQAESMTVVVLYDGFRKWLHLPMHRILIDLNGEGDVYKEENGAWKRFRETHPWCARAAWLRKAFNTSVLSLGS